MTAHIPRELLTDYVLNPHTQAAPGAGAQWALEAHVERCAVCQAVVREVSLTRCPADSELIAQVGDRLSAALAPVSRRRGRRVRAALTRWAAPTLGPWTAAVVLVVLTALILSSAVARTPLPLLLAPLMPLLGVALSWGPYADPAHELIATTARSGLGLLLRRTLAVLTLVIPALAAVGGLAGGSPALVLLPALALVCACLALGGVVGVSRAAALLSTGWALLVIVPALGDTTPPPLLRESATPAWGAATVLLSGAVVLCRSAHLHPGEARTRRH
ncbi:zf-HC2 domain-containing protein [Streptomyces sp. MC1]|uniref:hypothetical protein n=1 Tax=unclassified Streptomyces TaxID=2593676 RepID=UPI0006647335|nr:MULTISPECIES: hypothetical protein [unclassified Streptomyces]MBG7702437.1 zf-HC2 domain-containing protein [Streptomyces sp. MC1]